jgi:drug/metabolite transporter (DMT)-like permease
VSHVHSSFLIVSIVKRVSFSEYSRPIGAEPVMSVVAKQLEEPLEPVANPLVAEAPAGIAWATLLGILALVTGWASAFPGIRVGLTGFGPIELGALRFAVAAVPAALLLAFSQWNWPSPREFARIGLCGVLSMALYTSLLNLGERTVSGGAASFICGVAPILAALLASRLLEERFGWRGWAGIAISFAGVGIIAAAEDGGVNPGSGAVWILGAAVSAAFAVVLQKPVLARHRPLVVASWMMVFSAIALVPALPAALTEAMTARPAAIAAALYLGIVPSFFCYAGWTVLLSRLPAGRAASLLYGVPPVSTAISFAWLGEEPGTLGLLGGAMALAGVALVNLRRKGSTAR